MKIEILGPGCRRCQALEANARAAAQSLGLECEFKKVTDVTKIVDRGVMVTPALALDGQVKISGRVASESELRKVITEALSRQKTEP